MRITGLPAVLTARSRAATQLAGSGWSQSACSTRVAFGRLRSQWLCQWLSGEPCQPGRIR
ncbi:hypothetical protein D3C78_1679270 [compost metagenome]